MSHQKNTHPRYNKRKYIINNAYGRFLKQPLTFPELQKYLGGRPRKQSRGKSWN